VLGTIYLVFTTAHHAPSGRLDSRLDLAAESIRLARLLVSLMPDESECAGLLALILATHARAAARLDSAGNLVLLDEQDRSQYDHAALVEAERLVDTWFRRRSAGPYLLQAAIAVEHGAARTYAETDWIRISGLYRLLEASQPTAVVRVNRAVAEARAFGPEAGLALLDTVEGAERWHLLWSTRGGLLAELGRSEEASDSYRRALTCEMNDSDRAFLERRLADLDERRMTND
jgi:RNA polymerase sigma-70 factor (ECF subfamily)